MSSSKKKIPKQRAQQSWHYGILDALVLDSSDSSSVKNNDSPGKCCNAPVATIIPITRTVMAKTMCFLCFPFIVVFIILLLSSQTKPWLCEALVAPLLLRRSQQAFHQAEGASHSRKHGLQFDSNVPVEDEPRGQWRLPLPPGRPTNPWIRILFDDTTTLLNPCDMKLLQRKAKFGPIFKTNFLLTPCVFCSSEEAISLLAKEEAWSTTRMRAFFPPHHTKLFGPNSLLVQSGSRHQAIRRLVMGSLSSNTIQKSYEPIIYESMQAFFNRYDHDHSTSSENSEQYVAMVPVLRRFFISIVLQVVLGTIDVSKQLVQDVELWSKGLLAPPLTFLPFTTAGKAIRARKRIVKQLRALMESQPSESGLMAKLLQVRDNRDSERDDDDEDASSPLSSNDSSPLSLTTTSLTHDEIIDNLFTLIFAGSDTTSSAALSIWKALTVHPQLQQELVSHPETIESFVQSVLEAYPPAPFNMRQTSEDITIGEYHVPAKWLVAYGYAAALEGRQIPSSLHDTVETNVTRTPISSSIAFGQGPRKCPGRFLAATELIIFTKALIHTKWEIDPHQNLEQTYTPGYFPVDGFKVRFMT